MPFPPNPPYGPMHCHHDIHQIKENAFECHRCGMIFFGVERSHPDINRIMDSCERQTTYKLGQRLSSMNIPVTHVDLGSMPQDINTMHAKMDDMEKALSFFSEVLKDAIQT